MNIDRDVGMRTVEDPRTPVHAWSMPWLFGRVSTTRAPSLRRSAARYVATLKLNLASV